MRIVVQGEEGRKKTLKKFASFNNNQVTWPSCSRESCNPVAHLLRDDYCSML